ncbi:uncharacterized protein LOC126558753 [Anopheles maculipalpis]|uniref:uncharacterized protein LOC126558753 n=1 Tax=Anopheles maculipalpis TaxID=1496333 RepID=UPI0021595BAD|nr:uncharacterized protein LOC126558753 [Anopheles maculipalpis]
MYPKDRNLLWVLLVTAGHLWMVRVCKASEHVAGPIGRKLNHGLGVMHHNHLMLHSDGLGESVKFSANSVPHVPYSGPAAWRISATVSTPLASSWKVRKPLAKPARGTAGGSRSRINNRSMTRFSEVEIPPGLEQQLDAPDLQRVPETGTAEETGLVELYRSAERSRGIENLFWKYFVDNDVSASVEDDDTDDESGGIGGIDKNALQTDGQEGDELEKGEEGRKKKFHLKKKYKKFLIPLLLAYKIKFLALVPAIIGGLILLVKSAGLAGFFFALFTAVVSLKKY